jgi:hypothetical protein
LIHRVELTTELDIGVTISHHFEQIVDSTEEAAAFGKTCAVLMNAYNHGFGEADLTDDG